MRKIDLVIADRDRTYLDRMLAFIRASEWAERVNVRMFSLPERLEEHVRSGDKADLYVIQADFAPGLTVPGCRVELSEDGRHDLRSNVPSLRKYQPADILLEQAVARMEGELARRGAPHSRRTRFVSVYSAAGGCGKTTVSLHLARSFVRKGYRTLYLNFELFPSVPTFRHADANELSQLVYDLRNDERKAADRLRAMALNDAETGIEYWNGFADTRQTEELSGADSEKMFQAVAALGKYDVAVVDLESSLHARIVGALETSDIIVWLIQPNALSRAKTAAGLNGMRGRISDRFDAMADRIRYVVNKWTGREGTDGTREDAMPVAWRLPYVPQWKTLDDMKPLWNEPLFAESAIRLTDVLLEGLRVVNGYDDARHRRQAVARPDPGTA